MAELACREKENVICHQHFLNMDISLDIIPMTLKSLLIILHTHKKGTLSQIFDIGPSFY